MRNRHKIIQGMLAAIGFARGGPVSLNDRPTVFDPRKSTMALPKRDWQSYKPLVPSKVTHESADLAHRMREPDWQSYMLPTRFSAFASGHNARGDRLVVEHFTQGSLGIPYEPKDIKFSGMTPDDVQDILHPLEPDPREVWDRYFLTICATAATKSKDPSTKCGSIIVRPDRTIVSLGYNGFPRGMADTDERLSNREEKLSRVIHAEINALTTARESLQGCTLYIWPLPPCDRCMVQVIQSGIKRVVTLRPTSEQAQRWDFTKTREYAAECGVELKEYEQ